MFPRAYYNYLAEVVIGWESASYTTFEGDQGSEVICLLVENRKVLARPATLGISTPLGISTAQREDCLLKTVTVLIFVILCTEKNSVQLYHVVPYSFYPCMDIGLVNSQAPQFHMH